MEQMLHLLLLLAPLTCFYWHRRLVKLEIKMAKLVDLVSKSQVMTGSVNPETTSASSYPVAPQPPKRNTSSGSRRHVRSHVSSEAAEYGKSR